MASNEDNFWNESFSSGLKFFDDDDDTAAIETESFSTNAPENITLPIHAIISNESLKIILDETDLTVEHVVSPPEETVRRMFHGENVELSFYKTLQHKLELLDTSIDIADGNIILTVIIFLSRTLNNNIFFTQLSKRKVAVRHYANYLIERNNLQELADLYMATGHIFHLKDIYSLLSKDIKNQNVLLKKLDQYSIHHAQNLNSNEDRQEVAEHISFLEFQIKNKTVSTSVVEHLINLCKSEWGKGSGDELIYTFKRQFKLDDFQFDWVLMSILCKMKNWDTLIAMFIKSVWVLKKRALKSVCRPDLFIVAIGKHNPPEYVMEQFLSCVGDTAKVLYLAEKLKLHMYIVNYHIEQKDKMALLKYMEKVDAASPAMYAIQSSLNNSDIKWKN